MTNDELIALLKDVPLDDEHEIGMISREDGILEKLAYDTSSVKPTFCRACFQGRIFYDKTRDVITLTDDEKHVVGGVLLMSQSEIHMCVLPNYEGQGYMSSFMRSGMLNCEAITWNILPIFCSSVHIDHLESLCVQKMEKRYYLCQLASIHISNERELMLAYADVGEILIRQVLQKDAKHYLIRLFLNKFQRQIYEYVLVNCFVGYLLFDQVIPFAKMDNYDYVKRTLLQPVMQKFADCLWDFVNQFGDEYVNNYETWAYERNVSALSYSRSYFYHHDGLLELFPSWCESWIGVYLYVKEKMEHFTLIQTEKFERQHLEDMVYKLRVRYRVEHGYPTDDCYRYVEASHQFVNEFAAI